MYKIVEETSQGIIQPVEDSGYLQVSLEQLSYVALSQPVK